MAGWKCTIFGVSLCFVALNTILALQGSNLDPTPQCIFDKVQMTNVGKTNLNYKPDASTRGKRDTRDPYQPIRIKTIVQDSDNVVDTTQVMRLTTIIGGAVSVIRKLFSVYPVTGPLIMSRIGCHQVHSDGPNVGRCATISRDYVGEKCLDNFLIPDDHLEGLWTWDAINPEPHVTHYAAGSGIPNTDTVLYVKAEHTDSCNSGQIVAYASNCKLDQFNRPIAGVINFCPEPLLGDLYDEDKFVLLALHEILHVLGFSSSLFDKFQDCRVCAEGLDCEPREDVVVTDWKDQPRLHTPAASAAAQAHFGCHDPNLGAPLENLAGTGFSSHWETRHMYGSLMAPVIDQPHSTFLDNLTLAVFEDSGWYKVNYDYADDFLWGKGQGCDFGLPELCASNFSDFFCNDSSTGCDYLHLNKGTCSTNDYLDGCRVFHAETDNHCTLPTSSSVENSFHNSSGELTGSDSRCFISNDTTSSLSGKCFATRCNATSEYYEIRLENSEWIACPAKTIIQIPGYNIEVHCPSADIICRNYSSLLSLVDPVCLTCNSTTTHASISSTTTPQTSDTQSSSTDVNLSLEFNNLEYSEVDEEDEISLFEGTIKQSIAEITSLQEDRIQVRDIRRGSVVVIVYLAEATEESDVSAQNAYVILSSAVQSGQFCIKYNQLNYTAASVSLIDVSISTPPQPSSSSNPPNITPTQEPTTNAISQTSIGILALLGVLFLMSIFIAICLCKKKKTAAIVSPAPATTNKEGASPGRAYVVGKDK